MSGILKEMMHIKRTSPISQLTVAFRGSAYISLAILSRIVDWQVRLSSRFWKVETRARA